MAFPTTPILDSFTRANENPLTDAGKWTSPIGFGDNAIKIVSNKGVVSTSGSKSGAIWNSPIYGPDCEVYVTIPVLPDTSGPDAIWMYFRMTDFTLFNLNGYALGWDLSAANQWNFARYDSGTGSPIGGAAAHVSAILAGDSIGVQAIGNVFTAYRKTSGVWSTVYTWTDNSSPILLAGQIGVQIDNFVGGTSGAITNFGGGNVVTGGSVPTIGGVSADYQWLGGDDE